MPTEPVIDRVAISLGFIDIHWYGLLIGLSAVLGFYLVTVQAKRLGIDPEKMLDMMFWVVPAAIVGARLYYVIFQWDVTYKYRPWDALAIWQGGLAIHGVLIAALIAVFLFVRKYGLPFLLILDITVPSLLLGQAIGRWGNFINQEAYGSPVSRSFLESIYLPEWMIEQMHIQGAYFHPTFLYESIWNLIGFGLLMFLLYRTLQRGSVFFSYLMWYSLGRFFIEGLRTDSLSANGPVWLEKTVDGLWSPMKFLFEPGMLVGGNIRVAQLISIVLFLAAGTYLLAQYYRKNKEAKQKETMFC